MQISKRYYVIYDGSNVIMSGCSDGMAVYANAEYAEFDTEAEMNQYIAENDLIEVTNETN